MHRMNDMNFIRDTIKKLIYAVEQNEIAIGTQGRNRAQTAGGTGRETTRQS